MGFSLQGFIFCVFHLCNFIFGAFWLRQNYVFSFWPVVMITDLHKICLSGHSFSLFYLHIFVFTMRDNIQNVNEKSQSINK